MLGKHSIDELYTSQSFLVLFLTQSYEISQAGLEFTVGETSLELEILLSHPPWCETDLNIHPS